VMGNIFPFPSTRTMRRRIVWDPISKDANLEFTDASIKTVLLFLS
jgi:hypothetical protein